MYARIVIVIAASAFAVSVANAQTPTGPQGGVVTPGYATGTTTGTGASGGGSTGGLNGNGAVGLGTVGTGTMNSGTATSGVGAATSAPSQAQAPSASPSNSTTNKNDCLNAVQGANLPNETCGGL
jgi:hypothetical protein